MNILRRFLITLVFLNALYVSAQDSNIQISLDYPAYGIKIKNNFPGGSGPFARAFMLSNQDASVDFFGLGVRGELVNGIGTPSYGYLGQDYSNPMMAFMPNGNVGIGTITPGEKLSVNGKIRAHEIKVETANWPDYVFNKDYQLPSLHETEKHINEKGHLPGIPSAEEVKANGIDVGEMNAKLLQKIEELTLHLIELKKENQVMKSQLINLEKRIEE